MDRRSVLSLLGIGMLGGCGGGGGGADATAGTMAALDEGLQSELEAGKKPKRVPEPAPAPAPDTAPAPAPAASPAPAPAAAPAPVAALSRNIACWGDSMTDLYVPHLRTACPDRQVYNGGVIGQTSTQIAARQTADTEHKSWISVFWYGHNNWRKDPVPGDVAASVASLAPGNKAFIVMSMVNWAQDGERGTAEYDRIMQANAALAAAYPDNYLDIHRHLVNLYNPNSWQDVQDFNNDLPPSSLRFDRIHLNGAGCDAVAAKIREFVTARGW